MTRLRLAAGLAAAAVAVMAAPGIAAPPKPIVSREAEGTYIGGKVGYGATAHDQPTPGHQIGVGRLRFEIYSAKTELFVSMTAEDEITPATPVTVSFLDATGAQLDGTEQGGLCGAMPKTRIPAKATVFVVEPAPTGCGTSASTSGTVHVTFTNR